MQISTLRNVAWRASRPSISARREPLRVLGCTGVSGRSSGGITLTPQHFALRTDDQIAYGQLIAAGAGIGFTTPQQWRQWPEVQPLLPQLKIPPLPCWLAVHREIRGNPLVRLVYDHLAQGLGRVLG